MTWHLTHQRGGTIAFAMSVWSAACWMSRGSASAMGTPPQSPRLIGKRQGFGDRLAEGSRLLAESIGATRTSLAPHVKGLEIPATSPRAAKHGPWFRSAARSRP